MLGAILNSSEFKHKILQIISEFLVFCILVFDQIDLLKEYAKDKQKFLGEKNIHWQCFGTE